MGNELQEIPYENWIQLRDLYEELRDCASSYNTVETFIDWRKKEPDFPIEIYSLNGDWESDGTFVAIMSKYYTFCNTLSACQSRLVDALNCVDPSKSVIVGGFQHRLLPAVEKHFLDMGFVKGQFQPHGTYWFHLPRQEVLKLEIKIPLGIRLSSLEDHHAQQVNEIWPHKTDGSIEFVRALIRLNKNVGIFDGEQLVAWCLILPLGSLGLLQVEEPYKRKGLGSLAVRYMAKLLAESDIEVTAPVVLENVASQSMFKKLGFKVIDQVFWAVRSPKS